MTRRQGWMLRGAGASVFMVALYGLGCSGGAGGGGGADAGRIGGRGPATGGAVGAGGALGMGGISATGGALGTGGGDTRPGSGGAAAGGSRGTGGGAAGGATGTGGAGTGGAPTGGTSGGAGRPGGTGGTGGTAGPGGAAGGAGRSGTVSWETRTLSTLHTAEGADVGDIDGDGVLDLVAGPTWYKGTDFSVGGTLMPNPPSFTMNEYSTFFLTFVDDVDGDGRPDVIAIGDAGGANGTGTPNAFWYKNPGPANLAQPWVKQAIFSGLVANESPAYVNVVGDAKKELVFMTNQQLGYARPAATAAAPWTFTAINGTSVMFGTPYVHGLGAGDIDGDGVIDLVERSGWWRQVAGATWERHAFEFWVGTTSGRAGNWGGSQMQVFDVDGDGDNDVVTVLAAHQYGLAWFEHQGTGAAVTFVGHQILPTTAGANNVSQLHSMVAVDVNGDGLTDVVTGKRYYAHPSTSPDPGTTDPPVISWFELQRGAAGATFVQHVIHENSGAGCNFVARDLNRDGKVDIFTTNKRGTFLHLQR